MATKTCLTDAEWELLQSLLPDAVSRHGRPRRHSLRTILNAIFYVLRTGCAWRFLPTGLPARQTVYYFFRKSRRDGSWRFVHTLLREWLRPRLGRTPQPTP